MKRGGVTQDPWSLLGIAETVDTASIRSAYVRRLRELQPDRDPEAFQALRAARDRALALAAGDQVERPREAEPAPRPEFTEEGSAATREEEEGFARVMTRLETFLDAPWTRSDAHSWEHFLHDLPILSPDQLIMVEREIAERIDRWLDEDTLPAGGILLVVNDRFGWDRSDCRLPYFLDQLAFVRLRAAISSVRG